MWVALVWPCARRVVVVHMHYSAGSYAVYFVLGVRLGWVFFSLHTWRLRVREVFFCFSEVRLQHSVSSEEPSVR